MMFGLFSSSLTLQVVYSATILGSISTTSYNVLEIRPSFLQGAAYNLLAFSNMPVGADKEVAYIQSNLTSFDRLNNADCLSAYFEPLVTNRGDLLLVVDDSDMLESVGLGNSILTWKTHCIDCAGSLDWLSAGIAPQFIQDNSTSPLEPCTIPLVRRNLRNAAGWTNTGGPLG